MYYYHYCNFGRADVSTAPDYWCRTSTIICIWEARTVKRTTRATRPRAILYIVYSYPARVCVWEGGGGAVVVIILIRYCCLGENAARPGTAVE